MNNDTPRTVCATCGRSESRHTAGHTCRTGFKPLEPKPTACPDYIAARDSLRSLLLSLA